MNDDKKVVRKEPNHPRVQIESPSPEEIDSVKSVWNRLGQYVKRKKEEREPVFEVEFIANNERSAFINFYLDRKQTFHGNLMRHDGKVKLDLVESFKDYDDLTRFDYKKALLAIGNFVKKTGIEELMITIQDSSCSGPSAKSFEKTMEAIGLKRGGDCCGDWTHETWFEGKVNQKQLPYKPASIDDPLGYLEQQARLTDTKDRT